MTFGVADEHIETDALPEPDEKSVDVVLTEGQRLKVGVADALRLTEGQ